MREEILTSLERKILEEIVRPAITPPKPDFFYGRDTMSETVHFGKLVKSLKEFYLRYGGTDWGRLLREVDTQDVGEPMRPYTGLPNDYDPPSDDEKDDLFEQARAVVLKHGKASTSLLQRELKCTYVKSSRLIDQLETAGIIGPKEGAKPRKVL